MVESKLGFKTMLSYHLYKKYICYSPIDSELLRQVNCTALSSAFDRTLSQLESAILDRGGPGEDAGFVAGRVMRAVRYCGDVAWGRFGGNGIGESGEKLAAEVLWLAQKMADCGCVEEAVWKWGSAKKLAWLALSAEPRIQCSLVKVSGTWRSSNTFLTG